MPTLKTETALELGRRARVLFRTEIGLTGLGKAIADLRSRLRGRGAATKVAPSRPAAALTTQASPPKPDGDVAELRRRLAARKQSVERLQGELARRDRELAALRTRVAAHVEGAPVSGIRPENLIWVFGVARTGSTWLSAMMGELEGHAEWPEPYVGDVFGFAYYNRAWDWMRGRKDYVLGDQYRDVWLTSIRNFVLDGANARYPEVADGGWLVVKEPNGSLGAPLLTEALPESRFVLLVRDPRDVVASLLAANKKGSWTTGLGNREDSVADTDPDEFVRQRAHLYMVSMLKAKEGYDNHRGPKAVIAYENLRYQAFDELQRLYSGLGVPVDEEDLRKAVEKHDWENVPADRKGADKPQRKAKPGGYSEDLTPAQVKVVEEITASILAEFYPQRETVAG